MEEEGRGSSRAGEKGGVGKRVAMFLIARAYFPICNDVTWKRSSSPPFLVVCGRGTQTQGFRVSR